jgi:hypothetical protein
VLILIEKMHKNVIFGPFWPILVKIVQIVTIVVILKMVPTLGQGSGPLIPSACGTYNKSCIS